MLNNLKSSLSYFIPDLDIYYKVNSDSYLFTYTKNEQKVYCEINYLALRNFEGDYYHNIVNLILKQSYTKEQYEHQQHSKEFHKKMDDILND